MTALSDPQGLYASSDAPAWKDLSEGLFKYQLWGRIGWLDVKRRYRRTVIGPFWSAATLALYIIAVGVVGAGLWHQGMNDYLPYLSSGMIVWTLISTIILEACTLFILGHALLRNVSFEYSVLSYALVWRNLIIFGHNLVVYILIALVLKPALFSPTALIAIPGTLLVLANGVWIALLVGMLCLRYRDVQPLVQTAIQILMLITPIFWTPESLGGRLSAPVCTAQSNLPSDRSGARAVTRSGPDISELSICCSYDDCRMGGDVSHFPPLPRAHFVLELERRWRWWFWKACTSTFQFMELSEACVMRCSNGLPAAVIQREGKRQERVVVRALSNISMRLEDGDRLGLIGHNGSGKSTLLKVIAGIYQPVSGRMTVEGRVTPLLDMMPGLDPDDTGYENLLTAGMLLGLSREEVEQKIPEIEEFSELGEYLALPVRTYSAGMTLRLGFSLVTALKPGILLMDEGFSTGDLRFAERAADRMDDFLGRSRIIVLASHSDETIKSMCNKAALMQEGQILAFGPVDDVIEQYREMVHPKTSVAAEVQRRAAASSALPQPVYSEETDSGCRSGRSASAHERRRSIQQSSSA